MQKVHIQNLRLYFSGNNLLYFTNYNGFTPEILGGLDRDIYPITATCRFGLNLTILMENKNRKLINEKDIFHLYLRFSIGFYLLF
mgnify:CR=1 FL=1